MPNHVFNSMTVTGNKLEIQAFTEKAKLLHNKETNEPLEEVREFSYWNFVTPPEEAVASGEYWGTHGFAKGEQVGNTRDNWYNFNVREWGTKWDAYDVDVEVSENQFSVKWSSAWSPPTNAMIAMVEQHPSLDFDFRWEEEQGWGGEAIGTRGDFIETREWDTPTSHGEWEDIGNPDGCPCNWDIEYAYSDCPTRLEESDTLVLDSTI